MTNELQQFENFVETKIVEPVENFLETNPTAVAIETDLKTAFATAESIVERNGGSLLLSAAINVLPSLVVGNWAAAVTNALADAKAAGAVTVPAEEQLAASTALQVAQVIAGPNATPIPNAPATVATAPASLSATVSPVVTSAETPVA